MDASTAIRRTREVAEMKQGPFARLVGTSQPSLSDYERGARVPSDATLRRILLKSGVRPTDVLAAYREDVLAVCERYGAADVRVIGSVARGEDSADSDIDLLMRFPDGTSLLDVAALQRDLEQLLGRSVDVVSEAGLRFPDDEKVLAEARLL
jgi:uncharacterized protein